MIVVAIIGLLAAIALPSFQQARERAQNIRFVNDLRVAVGTFKQAIIEAGFPPDNTPAKVPSGMEEYLQDFPWTEDTPIGGQWDWDYLQFGVRAGVSVYQPDVTVDRMRDIDAIIDDGDLSTGIFRARSDGYIRIIEF